MINKKRLFLPILVIFILPQLSIAQTRTNSILFDQKNPSIIDSYFNASNAYQLIGQQTLFGPRIPGSEAIENTRVMLHNVMINNGKWNIKYQNFSEIWFEDQSIAQNITLVNIIYTPPDFCCYCRP